MKRYFEITRKDGQIIKTSITKLTALQSTQPEDNGFSCTVVDDGCEITWNKLAFGELGKIDSFKITRVEE